MQLKELQNSFVCSLLQKQLDENLSLWITARHPRRAVDSMDIYRHSRVARITKVLQNTFAVCLAIVGEHYFKQLCYHYMNTHFFNTHDITLYGIEFSQYLNDNVDKHRLDYLSDVAAFEWAYFNVHYQGQNAALDVKALALVSPQKQTHLKFKLGASHQLVQSDFPILNIWQAHQQDAITESIDLDAGGTQLLVYRRGWEVLIETLNAVEFLFLSCVSQGMTFEQIGDACVKAFPEAELTALFPKAVERGWITAFYL